MTMVKPPRPTPATAPTMWSRPSRKKPVTSKSLTGLRGRPNTNAVAKNMKRVAKSTARMKAGAQKGGGRHQQMLGYRGGR